MIIQLHFVKMNFINMIKKYFFLFFIISSNYLFGQAGIGTTTPVNKFQIETPVAAPLTSGTGLNGNLRLGAPGVNQVFDFGLGTSFGWMQARDKTGYGTNYSLFLNPNGGGVGIGTNNAISTLTVGNSTGTIPGEITLNPTGTINEGGQIIVKKSLTGSVNDWTIDQFGTTSANARLRFFNGLSELNGMVILENGNVGIGNNAPAARVDVTGNVAVSGNLTGGNAATSKLSGFVSNLSTEAASRTLALSDNGNILRFTASSGVTITLPASGIPEGFNCMVLQGGAGQITFSGTFYNRNGFNKTAGQYSIVTILYAGGVYIVSGEMSN